MVYLHIRINLYNLSKQYHYFCQIYFEPYNILWWKNGRHEVRLVTNTTGCWTAMVKECFWMNKGIITWELYTNLKYLAKENFPNHEKHRESTKSTFKEIIILWIWGNKSLLPKYLPTGIKKTSKYFYIIKSLDLFYNVSDHRMIL